MSRTILTDSAPWQSGVEDVARWVGQAESDVRRSGPADGGATMSEPTGNRTQEEDQSAPASPPVAGQTGLPAPHPQPLAGGGRSHDAAKAGRADEM